MRVNPELNDGTSAVYELMPTNWEESRLDIDLENTLSLAGMMTRVRSSQCQRGIKDESACGLQAKPDSDDPESRGVVISCSRSICQRPEMPKEATLDTVHGAMYRINRTLERANN